MKTKFSADKIYYNFSQEYLKLQICKIPKVQLGTSIFRFLQVRKLFTFVHEAYNINTRSSLTYLTLSSVNSELAKSKLPYSGVCFRSKI